MIILESNDSWIVQIYIVQKTLPRLYNILELMDVHRFAIVMFYPQLLLYLLFALRLFPSAIAFVLPHSGEPVVNTKLGRLRGVRQIVDDLEVHAYLGVPYAEKAIGRRRFRVPEMVEKWTGEFAADRPAKTCYNTLDTLFPGFPGSEMWNSQPIDEDCLTMNIWVPARPDGSVLVWVYGGGYFAGSPSLDLYDGRALAAMQNAIVVNINYRLGPFGFLYFGDDSSVPGNMGLLDQQLALRWIHENIDAFGGNPNVVTLFGESAGAASITSHLFAPASSSYFQRIVLLSGSVLNPWASNPSETMLTLSMSLAKKLNCTSPAFVGNIAETADCIRNKSSAAIQAAADAIAETEVLPLMFAFVPVESDANFFQGNVIDKIRTQNFKKDVDVLIGTVKDEGTFWLPYYLNKPKYGFHFNHTISAEDIKNQALINRAQYERSFHAFMPYFHKSPLVQHSLAHAYYDTAAQLSEIDLPRKLRDGVSQFVGDFFFTCDVIRTADLLSDNVFGNVYISSSNTWPKWMGVMHGYEIEYFFGLPLRRPKHYSPTVLSIEQRLSQRVMKLLVDFANRGVPISTWPKYNKVNRKAYVLDGVTHHETRLETDIRGQFCRLINEANNFVRGDCHDDVSQNGAATSAMTSAMSSTNGGRLLLPLIAFVFVSFISNLIQRRIIFVDKLL